MSRNICHTLFEKLTRDLDQKIEAWGESDSFQTRVLRKFVLNTWELFETRSGLAISALGFGPRRPSFRKFEFEPRRGS